MVQTLNDHVPALHYDGLQDLLHVTLFQTCCQLFFVQLWNALEVVRGGAETTAQFQPNV